MTTKLKITQGALSVDDQTHQEEEAATLTLVWNARYLTKEAIMQLIAGIDLTLNLFPRQGLNNKLYQLPQLYLKNKTSYLIMKLHPTSLMMSVTSPILLLIEVNNKLL